MAILVIISVGDDVAALRSLAKKSGCIEEQALYPFMRFIYNDEKKRNKALDTFRKNGYQAEIEA